MFAHLLLPLDSADRHPHSLEVAGEVARLHGASVTLLHVIETLEGADDEETRSFYQRLENRARDDLARAREDLVTTGVEADTVVVYGKRAVRILEAAEERGVDLIVMSSRSVERDGGHWPTLSHQIALASGCSVLLVR